MTFDLLPTAFLLRILGGFSLLVLVLAVAWLGEAWCTRLKQGVGAAAQDSRALLSKGMK